MSFDVRRFLADHGVSDEEVERAEKEGRLPVLVLDRLVLPGARRYTADEVAARVGTDRSVSNQLWRAMGFPDAGEDEPAFTDADVAALEQTLAGQLDDADLGLIVQQTRVLGAATARVAETVTDALVRGVEEMTAGGMSQEAISAVLAESFDIDGLGQSLDYVHRRQLVAAIRRRLVGRAGASAGEQQEVVGFADLAGFTAVSQQLPAGELTVLINRFESSSRDVVAEHGGRVVKSIGDEIMFVVDDPAAAAEIALVLVEVHEADEILPEVKVGLDAGPVLVLDGDYFGPVVNQASRVTELAHSGSVVASADLHERLADADGLRWSDIGRRKLKDIGSVHLWRLRRATRASGHDAGPGGESLRSGAEQPDR